MRERKERRLEAIHKFIANYNNNQAILGFGIFLPNFLIPFYTQHQKNS